MSKKKMTIAGIQKAKREGVQLTQMYADTPEEAAACEAAGIDIICTLREHGEMIRKAAPNTFLVTAYCNNPAIASEREAISAAFTDMEKGSDAIYSSFSAHVISSMTREKIPVIGHVGYVPYRDSWFGGPRAVGKKASEAMVVYEESMAFQDAGVIGVEMEIVPSLITEEITRRLDVSVISLGSGRGDIQYLFSTDVLGTNTGHYPRHAKRYADLHAELKKLQQMRIDTFKAFKEEVDTGAFPAANHLIGVKDDEYNSFIEMLDQR